MSVYADHEIVSLADDAAARFRSLRAARAREDAEAMSHVDGCPECVVNVEPPQSAVHIGDAWRCIYKCSDCGHSWTTEWAAESAQPCGLLDARTLVEPSLDCDNKNGPNRSGGTPRPGPNPLPFTRTGRGCWPQ